MKRLFSALLILCLLLPGCGSRNEELVVEVQKEATIATTEAPATPETEVPTVAATEPTTIPTTVPTTEATEPPTEPPTEPSSEATEPPTETMAAAAEIPSEEPAEVFIEELEEEPVQAQTEAPEPEPEPEVFLSVGQDYVLNKNTKKFHYPHCSSAARIKEKNRLDFTGSREEVLSMGYVPCKNCKP